MTAPAPPKFVFTYHVPLRHSVIRGNARARTEQEVRGIIAKEYGAEWAEMAVIRLAAIEEKTT